MEKVTRLAGALLDEDVLLYAEGLGLDGPVVEEAVLCARSVYAAGATIHVAQQEAHERLRRALPSTRRWRPW